MRKTSTDTDCEPALLALPLPCSACPASAPRCLSGLPTCPVSCPALPCLPFSLLGPALAWPALACLTPRVTTEQAAIPALEPPGTPAAGSRGAAEEEPATDAAEEPATDAPEEPGNDDGPRETAASKADRREKTGL